MIQYGAWVSYRYDTCMITYYDILCMFLSHIMFMIYVHVDPYPFLVDTHTHTFI